VRALKYSFGLGTSNSMAVRLDDGSWLVISPASGAPPDALEALAKDGPVSALVAPNAYHHMGQGAWRARFPQAKSYAPAAALPRLAKQAAGVPFEPLEALTAKLPARVACLVPDGMRIPDVLLRASSGGETVWFTGDLISNTVAQDIAAVPRFIFGLLGGGPGYRLNPVPAMIYLKDKAAWRNAAKAAFEQAPPSAVVPAHGLPVRDGVAEKTRALFA
jgi:hypothetical protein